MIDAIQRLQQARYRLTTAQKYLAAVRKHGTVDADIRLAERDTCLCMDHLYAAQQAAFAHLAKTLNCWIEWPASH
jgi:hypothetical protein